MGWQPVVLSVPQNLWTQIRAVPIILPVCQQVQERGVQPYSVVVTTLAVQSHASESKGHRTRSAYLLSLLTCTSDMMLASSILNSQSEVTSNRIASTVGHSVHCKAWSDNHYFCPSLLCILAWLTYSAN